MRRRLSDYDFVDFVTFMLAAIGVVLVIYMEADLGRAKLTVLTRSDVITPTR